MIRNQWYVILESKEVRKGKPLGLTRMGEKLVVWRAVDGRVSVMSDLCPHLGAPLCLGKVNGDRLACPFHGFEYDSSGAARYVPSLGRAGDIPKALKVRTYPTYEAHGWIWMYWGDLQDGLPTPRWFDIDDSFHYSGFHQHWPVHYSRMVENQLDPMHVPLVHSDSIGRGGRFVVEGPLVKIEEDVLSIWVFNRRDDGTRPRKAEELPEPIRPPFLVFNFPNLWENRINEDMRIVAAFAPVDEENSIIYIRYYQRFVKAPLLKNFVSWVGMLGSIYVTNQDRRIVSRQLPKRTMLKKMGEKLLQGDNAILQYRKHRHELLKKSNQVED